jgi:tetratricopeptide (TPR) repeat protein
MEFKSGPIKLTVGARPRDADADRATLESIDAKLQAGEVEAAVAMAEAALAQGLEHPLTLNLAAERLESEDRYAEALRLLERAYSLAPADLGVRQALALCLFRLQQFAAALPHFDAMVAAQPDFAPAHAARGAALEALGRADEAETAYRRAHELEPQNLLAIAGLASSASRSGRHAEARGFAERVVALEPGYPEAVLVLARADLAEGCYDAGAARLAALVEAPQTPAPHRALAQSLMGEIAAERTRKFDA